MNLINKCYLPLTAALVFLGLQIGNAQNDWKAYAGGQFFFAELTTSGSPAGFNTSFEPSAGIYLGVSRALNDSWSIHSGAGLSYLQTGTTLAQYRGTENAVDQEGESFEFRYTMNNYSERQQSMALSIPLSVQYETTGAQTRFYSKLGASATFFLSSQIKGEATDLVTSGYFERFNGELTAPRFAGFGTFNDIAFSKQDFDIENSYNAFLELGVKERIVASGWLYVGLFAEYGLNDLSSNNGSSLLQYNQVQPVDFINNSILNATNQATGKPFVEKLNLTTIGLRVHYEFGI